MIKKFIDKVFNKPAKAAAKAKIAGADTLGINPDLVSPNAVRVCQTLQEAGFLGFIVGGAVRDLLLGVAPKDFDVATNATPEQIQQLFRRSRVIGRRFQIVHVMMGRETLEVTTFRGASAEAAPKDEHGRVLNDNTFGNQQTDAQRRDFTVNAFYYDPVARTVHDYCGGLKDLKERVLRIIGNPETRFREDPVRMLRVVRFAAKLNFTVEKKTHAAIAPLADLIANVPPARLFDEIQKLLLSGHAVATVKRLRGEGLHHGLLPLLDVVLEQPLGEKFVMAALENTDERVRQSKSVTPSFLFAALLWHEVLAKAKVHEAKGVPVYPALNDAMTEVLDTQCESLAIPRRYTADMREIWNLQPRFDKRGRGAYKLVEHPRFRAGYDFYLLRCQSGEAAAESGDWWTQFYEADPPGRDALIHDLLAYRGGAAAQPASKKRRRRGPRNKPAEPSADIIPPQA